jgi:hypothetical protein
MAKMELASDFQPLEGEANFGPPITQEVVGGVHIAPECITIRNEQFVMVEWPNGLPRHETTRTVRFAHGLMRFGESMEECARRLVADQMGFEVTSISVAEIDSYLDDMNHWHIEPLLIVKVSGEPALPSQAGRMIEFSGRELPDGAVWGQASFDRIFKTYIEPTLLAGS